MRTRPTKTDRILSVISLLNKTPCIPSDAIMKLMGDSRAQRYKLWNEFINDGPGRTALIEEFESGDGTIMVRDDFDSETELSTKEITSLICGTLADESEIKKCLITVTPVMED